MNHVHPRRLRHAGLALCLALTLGACTGLDLRPAPMALYDLGVTPSQSLPAELAPAQLKLSAAPWLSATAMHYRLSWLDPSRRRAYAESRWVSAPADMLGIALDRGLAAGAGGLHCHLRVELDEFVQVFDSDTQSHVELIVRVALLPSRSAVPLARTEFRISEAAPSADASGGVSAHRSAAQRLVHEVSAWLVALDRASTPGLNGSGRCGV